ncbi:unnamed protein product [Brassica napus]|uniref:(rape) hypothetical protein n=1 Tax=Brassica napus TaxID=3708 RepID=A0A816TJD1_BRANA|nr:unnamed protein product [Brassica napus]
MEEVVEEIEAASSSGDPHSQSLMGFVYGTGMMREKSKSKSFLRHNFAAEGCNRKLAKSLWCNRCVSPNAPSSAVDDGKESATFVVFDREMIKLIKKEAKSGSCVDTLVAVGGMELPKCPHELAGNGYLFSYVGNSNKAPVVDLKSGQPTVFASSTGDAAKIAVGNDGANQPGSAYCRQRQNPQTPT